MHRLVGLKKLAIPNSQRMSAPRRGCLIRTCPGLGKSPFSQFCQHFWRHGLPEFRLQPCHMRSSVCRALWLHEAHITRYFVCVCFFLCAACSGTGSGMPGAKARGRREGGSMFLAACVFSMRREISPEELCSLPLSGCLRPTRLAARSRKTLGRAPRMSRFWSAGLCRMFSASKARGTRAGLQP